MGRKAQIHRVEMLRANLTQQRLQSRRSAQQSRLRPTTGWPIVAIGLATGFLAGSLRLQSLVSRMLSLFVFGMRVQRALKTIAQRPDSSND